MSNRKSSEKKVEEPELKGTLFAVAMIGLFIILSWSGVWYLFISR